VSSPAILRQPEDSSMPAAIAEAGPAPAVAPPATPPSFGTLALRWYRLNQGRLRAMAIGGLLHDIGKLSVPDAVLRKPGRLDDEEFAVIRRHPVWGDELAKTLGFPAPVRRLVRSHHERLDGKGYPDAATQLDLDVRILTVCDVYDALVSDRVYRSAMTEHEALAILDAERGTAFDPACVDALRALLGAGELAAA